MGSVEGHDGLFIDCSMAQDFLSVAMEKWGRVGVRLTKPFKEKSWQQHKALEAIISEWYRSGVHPGPPETVKSETLLREWAKSEFGIVLYVPDNIELVPYPFRWMCKKAKSVSLYSAEELNEFCNKVISCVEQTMQPLTWKMQEILRGMS